MRRAALLALVPAAIGIGLAAIGDRSAMSDPTVRHAAVALADWPAGAAPITLALVSDIHVGNASGDRARLARIVALLGRLRPDLVVLAGDFVASDPASARDLAPLARLRPPLGVVAVLGNHDHWASASRVRLALDRAGVTTLANAAIRRGPLAIGGVDDLVTRHADLARTRAAMRAVGGAGVLVSHSPDIAPQVAGGLVLAGHTHCGQILIPGYGPPVEVSRYAARYRCGIVREAQRTTIVTAGVGTSVVPLRWRAPPDLWLVRVGP